MAPQHVVIFLLIQYLGFTAYYAYQSDWGRAWYFFAAFQINFTALYLIK
jgi:hypothetical protein